MKTDLRWPLRCPPPELEFWIQLEMVRKSQWAVERSLGPWCRCSFLLNFQKLSYSYHVFDVWFNLISCEFNQIQPVTEVKSIAPWYFKLLCFEADAKMPKNHRDQVHFKREITKELHYTVYGPVSLSVHGKWDYDAYFLVRFSWYIAAISPSRCEQHRIYF